MSQGLAQVAKVNMKRNRAFESNVVLRFFKFNSIVIHVALFVMYLLFHRYKSFVLPN